MHTFERSGMGKAPFRYFTPTKLNVLEAGQQFFCDHCGTVILNRHFVKSQDGKVSVVGIDCLKKTGDAGLMDGLKRAQREQRADTRELERLERVKRKEASEREANGGKTLDELAAEKHALYIAEEKRIHSELLQWVGEVPLLAHLDSMDALESTFGKAMIMNVLSHQPLSPGMQSAMVKIEAKRLSGARVNSNAFKQRLDEAKDTVRIIAERVLANSSYLDSLR